MGDLTDRLQGGSSELPGLKEISDHWELGVWRVLRRFEQGVNNESFFLATDRGEFVLRRARASKTLEAIGFEYALIRFLTEHGIPVPEPVPGHDGSHWLMAADRLWTVASFIPSDKLKLTEEITRQVGEILARFHMAARSFQPPGPIPRAGSKAQAALKALEFVVPLLSDPEAMLLARRVGSAVPRAIAAETEATATLAQETIHGACRKSSVLFREGRLVGLLDLDSAREGTRALDIAIALASFARPRGGGDSLNQALARALRSGYTAVSTLAAGESRAIAPCVAGVLLHQAAADLARFARDPQNRDRLAKVGARLGAAERALDRPGEGSDIFDWGPTAQ